MMARFKAGYIQDMVLLVNKPPKWNESVRGLWSSAVSLVCLTLGSFLGRCIRPKLQWPRDYGIR